MSAATEPTTELATAIAAVDELLAAPRAAGRAEFTAVVRALWDAQESPLPDVAFAEPRLYAQMSQPGFDGATLDQLTLAARSAEGPATLDVVVDSSGTVHLPGIGLTATDLLPGPHPVVVDVAAGTLTAAAGQPSLPVRPAAFLAGTRAELVEHIDPVLERFLAEHVDAEHPPVLVEEPRGHLPVLDAALELIGVVRPAFHAALAESLRAVLLYRHPDAESFATLALHGLVAFAVPTRADLAFAVRELAHQGGHVLLSEATLHRQEFFVVDPDSALADVAGPGDGRELYDAFHGLYTEHTEVQVFLAALRAERVPAEQVQGFREHVRAVAKTHTHDLGVFTTHADRLLTPAGADVVARFRRCHELAARVHPDLVDAG